MSALTRIRQGVADWWPDVARLARDPWWVIGSSAAALLGAEIEVADIDLLTSTRDAEALAEAWSACRVPVGARPDDDRFRSRFGRYAFRPLPVEVMGDLEVNAGDGWRPLHMARTLHVSLADATLPVPSLEDQLALLRRFDRPKDHARVAALSALGCRP